MKLLLRFAFLLFLLPFGAFAAAPEYTADGNMALPQDYRSWVFLTSSLDLTYGDPVPGAPAGAMQHSMLDNVFVNPQAYAAFVATGAWPDRTVFVKENRVAASASSIATGGKFQTGIVSIELHIKDQSRFAANGGWMFFVSDGKNAGKPVSANASCFACHGDNGAVDTTFVQFYPTALEIAKAKHTLTAAYIKEEAAGKAP